MISYDEFIDDMVIYENYLICIFMNINKFTVKSEENRGKNYIHYKVVDMLSDLLYLASPGQILNTVSVVRETTLMP